MHEQAFDRLSTLHVTCRIRIVLVNPFLDRNVGAVARCMLNFGLRDLVLVQPQCQHLSQVRTFSHSGGVSRARDLLKQCVYSFCGSRSCGSQDAITLAAGAEEVLRQAQVFSGVSWPLGFLGFTRGVTLVKSWQRSHAPSHPKR